MKRGKEGREQKETEEMGRYTDTHTEFISHLRLDSN